jgi:glycosyltransferase involved in cell wall biosynthesis
VRYLEHDGHQNLGTNASRNLGINNANGKYIALLDADDVWLPNKLARQVAILESNVQAAMVYGPARWWYSWKGNSQEIHDRMQRLGAQPDTLVAPPQLLILFLRDEETTPSPSGIMVRYEAIKRLGGFEEIFRGMYDDQAFYASLCLESCVFISSECWYWHRQHPDSLCAVAKKKRQYHSARLTFLNWLEQYLAKREIHDDEIWAALHKELWALCHPTLHCLLKCVKHPISEMKGLVKFITLRTLPSPVHHWLRLQRERFKAFPRQDGL